MTQEQAIRQLRTQIKQLSAAAAEACLKDRPARSRSAAPEHPLQAFDALATRLATPALEALAVIERGAQPANTDTY